MSILLDYIRVHLHSFPLTKHIKFFINPFFSLLLSSAMCALAESKMLRAGEEAAAVIAAEREQIFPHVRISTSPAAPYLT